MTRAIPSIKVATHAATGTPRSALKSALLGGDMKNTLLTLGISLVVVGCAHGHSDTADRAFVMSPELVAHENIHRLGAASHTAVVASGQASAELRVCVAPDGSADKVVLTRSSGSDWFDRAATKELKESRYRRFRAPAHIRVCSPMKVVVADRQL